MTVVLRRERRRDGEREARVRYVFEVLARKPLPDDPIDRVQAQAGPGQGQPPSAGSHRPIAERPAR